jgi:uncharacterized protein HemY
MLSSISGRADFVKYLLLDGTDDDRVAYLRKIAWRSEDSVVSRYLLGRVYARMRRYAEAAQTLRTIQLTGTDAFLEATRQRTTAKALLHMGQPEEAKEMYWSSLNGETNEQTIKDVNVAIDQCEWMLRVPFFR